MLVSTQDVRRYLGGVTIEEGMMYELENVIARVQKVVETYLNRPVEKVQVREVARSDSKGFVYLSVTPVWKVLSCGGTTAQDTPTSVTPYTMVPDASLGTDPRLVDKVPTTYLDGRVSLAPGRLYAGIPGRHYVVEYIGGLDPNQIDDVKRVILQMVAREWGTFNIDAAGLEGGTPNMSEMQDNRGLDLSDSEKKTLQRYKRRVAL